MARQKKRSQVSADRMASLQAENALYVISCGIAGCPCLQQDAGCKRGFFSLFLQAIYGIDFAQRMQIPYHIHYGNCVYPYTDVQQHDRNYWNYYFQQPLPAIPPSYTVILNDFYEVYPLRIWVRSHFQYIHDHVIQNLCLQEPLENTIEATTSLIKQQRTLGIQIRRTDHHHEVAPVSTRKFLSVVDQRIHKFDKLFLATDDHTIATLFRQRYGDKLIIHDYTRSYDHTPLHAKEDSQNGYQLGQEVLSDCYCIAACHEAILMHSNISYAALLINPRLRYRLLEKHSSRMKRWKTNFLYYLNQWGIRAW